MPGNSLDGLFDQPKKTPLNEADLQRPMTEERFLADIVAGSQYKPQDVVAFGYAVNLFGVPLGENLVALTSRGVAEARTPEFHDHYVALYMREDADLDDFEAMMDNSYDVKSEFENWDAEHMQVHRMSLRDGRREFISLGGAPGPNGESRVYVRAMFDPIDFVQLDL